MKQDLLSRKCAVVMAACLAASCVLLACKGGRIPGSSSAAPHLEDRNAFGAYSPYYVTAPMNSPRYYHEAIRLKGGLILVTGGSDEKGYTAFDTAEIFDETTTEKDSVKPPSQSGVWYDTDFEGNPITMEFRRLWHTMTTLPDNRIILLGGATNFLKATPIEKVEIFDPETRTFQTLSEAKLPVPPVRHTANFLHDGTILIAGGQIHDVFTDVQQGTQSGFGTTQQVTVQTQTDIFPSTNRNQVFIFRDLAFSELTYPDSTRPSKLSSTRGRAGHVTIPFAGPDNHTGGLDDLYLLLGGFQTPSAPDLVPQTKFARAANETALTMIEVYDPSTKTFSQVGSVSLRYPRVNDPQGTNLGVFNETTPDGVLGLGNLILVCNGDDNADCFNTQPEDELFSASFTGFGPAQGLVFFRIAYTADSGHIQQTEVIVAGDIPASVNFQGRSETNIVPLAREVETNTGDRTMGTWIFNGAGASVICTPAGPVPYFDGCIGSGVLFDPFYRLIPAADFLLSPPPDARDLSTTRTTQNPTGIYGTWLGLDGKLPDNDLVGFGDVPYTDWAHITANRCFPVLVELAGEDGIINTSDDRILFSGGGQSIVDGGEATQPSAEILLIPDPLK